MKTYTITHSRRQILIETNDGQRWLMPRGETGRRDRRIAKLEAAGYTEIFPEPDTFTQLVQMAREGR
jgi:hypothetical protein